MDTDKIQFWTGEPFSKKTIRNWIVVFCILWGFWLFFPVWEEYGRNIYLWNLIGLWQPKHPYIDPLYFKAIIFQSVISLIASVFFVGMTAVTVFRIAVAYRKPTRENLQHISISFAFLTVSVIGVLFTKSFFLSGHFSHITLKVGIVFPLMYAAILFLVSLLVPRNEK